MRQKTEIYAVPAIFYDHRLFGAQWQASYAILSVGIVKRFCIYMIHPLVENRNGLTRGRTCCCGTWQFLVPWGKSSHLPAWVYTQTSKCAIYLSNKFKGKLETETYLHMAVFRFYQTWSMKENKFITWNRSHFILVCFIIPEKWDWLFLSIRTK